MHSYLFHQLITSFGCVSKTIHNFHVNMNGNAWAMDFKADNFGKFKVTNFKLSNASSVGNIRLSKEYL